jgi:hypothetical protein
MILRPAAKSIGSSSNGDGIFAKIFRTRRRARSEPRADKRGRANRQAGAARIGKRYPIESRAASALRLKRFKHIARRGFQAALPEIADPYILAAGVGRGFYPDASHSHSSLPQGPERPEGFMSVNRAAHAFLWLTFASAARGASLPCIKPGVERWLVKTSLPPGANTKTMTLQDALNLPRLAGVATNDPRFQSARITGQPVNEDTLVTISGWLYLVGFESDDCDFHIQISPEPRTSTNPPTKDDNCMIVEIPSGQYATSIAVQADGLRQWVVDNLLQKTQPKIGSVHVMAHPVFVTVTGALFYDDSHAYLADGGTGRGKKGMESKTLWELHPVTALAFAPAP